MTNKYTSIDEIFEEQFTSENEEPVDYIKISQQQAYNLLLPLKYIIDDIDNLSLQNDETIIDELYDNSYKCEKDSEQYLLIHNVIETIKDIIDPIDNAFYKIMFVHLNKYNYGEVNEILNKFIIEKQIDPSLFMLRDTKEGHCIATNNKTAYDKIINDKFVMHNEQKAFEIQKFNGKSRMSFDALHKELVESGKTTTILFSR